MSFTAQIDANIKGFIDKIDEAGKRLDEFEKSYERTFSGLKNIGDKFTDIGKKASALSLAIVVAGGKAYSMASDFEDALGATQQVFKDASDSVTSWANNLSSQYGIAKKEAHEYANIMGSMLKNIGGLTEEQSAKQASILIELAGDLTAMFGGSTQDAVRALTGALKGNNTMLDNYGMAVNDTLIKARAFEMGLISQGQEMSLQAKQAATLSLIMEQTADAQGQAAREADGASGTMRALRVEITNLSTELGQVLLPIITPIVAKVRDFVSAIRALSPETQSMIVAVSGIAAAIGPALVAVGKFVQLLPVLKIGLAALTGPVGLVVAAVVGAITLIIANWDKIKEYFTSGGGSEMFSAVLETANTVKEKLISVFEAIKTLISAIWERFGKYIVGAFEGVVRIVMNYVDTFMDFIKNAANILTAIFNGDWKGALDGLKNMFKDLFIGMAKIALNQLSVLSNYLASFLDAVGLDKWANSVKSFGDRIANAMTTAKTTTQVATVAIDSQKTKVKELTTQTDLLTTANNNLKDSQESTYLQGSNIFEVIKDNAKNILDLEKWVSDLRSGAVASKNAHEQISILTDRVGKLKAAQDLLTNGVDFYSNLKLKSSGKDVWENSSLFKNLSPTITPKIDTKLVEQGMGDLTGKLKVMTVDIGQMLSSGITDMMSNIGKAIANGDNVLNSIGSALLGTVGKMAQELGTMMISFGTAALALKSLMMNPVLAIAAGAALVALGAAASAAASKVTSGGTSNYRGGTSSYDSSPSLGTSYYRGAYNDDFVVTFVQKGSDLVGVLDTAQQKRNRI